MIFLTKKLNNDAHEMNSLAMTAAAFHYIKNVMESRIVAIDQMRVSANASKVSKITLNDIKIKYF